MIFILSGSAADLCVFCGPNMPEDKLTYIGKNVGSGFGEPANIFFTGLVGMGYGCPVESGNPHSRYTYSCGYDERCGAVWVYPIGGGNGNRCFVSELVSGGGEG